MSEQDESSRVPEDAEKTVAVPINESDPLGSGHTYEEDVDEATQKAIEQGVKDHEEHDGPLPDQRDRNKRPI